MGLDLSFHEGRKSDIRAWGVSHITWEQFGGLLAGFNRD